jgi:uncharacterized protein YjgD (DUF1641 family)
MSEQEQPESADGVDVEDLEPLVEAVDGNEEELARLVERLDDVNQLLDVLALGTGAMDDEMVTKLAATGNNLGAVADAAAEPETVRGVESMLHAVGDATGDLEEAPERLGVVGLLRALRDPEVQAGMGFLVAVARNLGADLTRRSELREGMDAVDADLQAHLEEAATGGDAESGEAAAEAVAEPGRTD